MAGSHHGAYSILLLSGNGDQKPQPDFGYRSNFYTFSPESLERELPEYEILAEVGQGSMGLVYEARRRADGLRVALKVLPPSLTITERLDAEGFEAFLERVNGLLEGLNDREKR